VVGAVVVPFVSLGSACRGPRALKATAPACNRRPSHFGSRLAPAILGNARVLICRKVFLPTVVTNRQGSSPRRPTPLSRHSRQWTLDDQVKLNLFDESFAAEQARTFADDLAHSKRYTCEDW